MAAVTPPPTEALTEKPPEIMLSAPGSTLVAESVAPVKTTSVPPLLIVSWSAAAPEVTDSTAPASKVWLML